MGTAGFREHQDIQVTRVNQDTPVTAARAGLQGYQVIAGSLVRLGIQASLESQDIPVSAESEQADSVGSAGQEHPATQVTQA